MELYTLDSLYRRIEIIDRFESLIWAERWYKMGDFELHIPSTLQNRTRFKVGTRLAMNRSKRVMTVETVQDSTDDEGRKNLVITGRSLEYILDNRAALAALSDLTTNPKWVLTGTPMEIANQIYHDICVTGTLDAGDIISNVTEGSIYPADTIDPPSDEVTIEINPTTVYNAESQVCQLYNLGFRLVRDPDSNQLYFDVYSGSDRTTQQTTLTAVIFSPDLENLHNITELTSIALSKNVAYVMSKNGSSVVYLLDVDPSTAGFDRNVLVVADDTIEDDDPGVEEDKRIQRGKEELAKNRPISALDGEVSQSSQYTYEVDYFLGDLIELRNDDGVTNQMRVSEHIFIEDEQGERSYPSLELAQFITPGSWAGQPVDLEWIDLDEDPITWSEEP